MGFGRELGDVADFDEQPGGAGWADAAQVQQMGAGLTHECLEFFVGGFAAPVDAFEVGDEFGGHATAGLACRVWWAAGGQ